MAALYGAGVILLCLSSSVGVYFFSQTDEENPTGSAAAAAAGSAAAAAAAAGSEATPAAGSEATPAAGSAGSAGSAVSGSSTNVDGYSKFDSFTFSDTKIGECTSDTTASACGIKCEYNNNCIGFTHERSEKVCCLHSELKNLSVDGNSATYVRKQSGYITEKLGDRNSSADPLQTITTGIEDCAISCTGNKDCIGFSYIDGTCELKDSSVSRSHELTGGQFYTRDNYPETLPKARYVVLKMENTPSKHVIVSGGVKVVGLDGTDIAAGKPVTATGSHGTSSPQGLTGAGSWHSLHTSGERSAKIDLGSEQTIKYISVNNGCSSTTEFNKVACNARLSGGGPGSSDRGAFIELLNNSGVVTRTSKDIKHIAGTYTLDFMNSGDNWT
jgi:hypothetical protein